MSATRVSIPHKVRLDELFAAEVNDLAIAVNEHADELDTLNAVLDTSEVTNPARAAYIGLSPREALLKLINEGAATSVPILTPGPAQGSDSVTFVSAVAS